jgi:DNA-binding NarL/FixJ family response regulator
MTGEKAKIRVVLIDDHPVVLAGARALIDASDDMVCVGDANDGPTALAVVQETDPDVVVMDVSLRDVSGLDLAQQMIEQGCRAHIVMMTLFEERKYVDRALQIGAKGFVQKRSAEQNLLLAIRTAMLGGLYLDPATAQEMANPATAPAPGPDLGLTNREREVLQMVALGYSNKEVAYKASVSVKSVETYKARATEKLKLYSRAQIVDFAIKNGWMTLSEQGHQADR